MAKRIWLVGVNPGSLDGEVYYTVYDDDDPDELAKIASDRAALIEALPEDYPGRPPD